MSGGVDRPLGMFHRVLRADALSVRRTLTELRRCLGGLCPPDALGRLELVLAEALNNVVEHGVPPALRREDRRDPETPALRPARAVHLLVRAYRTRLTVLISDDGVLLPSDCLAPRNLPSCELELPEGGFGWFLIQDLVSELSYARAGGRNHLAFVIPLQEEPVAA